MRIDDIDGIRRVPVVLVYLVISRPDPKALDQDLLEVRVLLLIAQRGLDQVENLLIFVSVLLKQHL